jgi:polyferredoxin
VGGCPIGAMQLLSANPLTVFSFYVYGMVALFGLLLGRVVCGFLCPFGLVQELLFKIPLKKKLDSRAFPILQYGKYVVLGVLVIGIPTFLTLSGQISFPAFCKYICPVGTLEAGVPLALTNARISGGLGLLFVWKMALLLLTLFSAIKIYRPFCRFLCPLGAIYSLFNKISIVQIREDHSKCAGCSECGALGVCNHTCPLNLDSPGDRECIRCGRCVTRCKNGGKRWTFGLHKVAKGGYFLSDK